MLASILSEAAVEIGAKVFLEPQWKYAGQIAFASGKRAYFRGSSIDINPHGASEIAKDKDYAAFFMAEMGFPAVRGEIFFSDERCAAIKSDRDALAAEFAAQAMGYPLIVKPNSESQGRGVFTVESLSQLRVALNQCFLLDRVAIVQPLLSGRDYRVVVLADEVISAYERIPLSVCGDGRCSISDLIIQKDQAIRESRGSGAKLPAEDPRIDDRLRRSGLQRTSVPKEGEIVYLLDNANLSSGGDAIDRTADISPNIAKLCVEVTAAMGLKLCGVDLIVEGDISQVDARIHILEVNSSPGLDNYAAIGDRQKDTVRLLYKKVLNYIERQ